jgi:hypothetical protein
VVLGIRLPFLSKYGTSGAFAACQDGACPESKLAPAIAIVHFHQT